MGRYVSNCYIFEQAISVIIINEDSSYIFKRGELLPKDSIGTWSIKKDTLFLMNNAKKKREKEDYSWDRALYEKDSSLLKSHEKLVKFLENTDKPLRFLIKRKQLVDLPYDDSERLKGGILYFKK